MRLYAQSRFYAETVHGELYHHTAYSLTYRQVKPTPAELEAQQPSGRLIRSSGYYSRPRGSG